MTLLHVTLPDALPGADCDAVRALGGSGMARATVWNGGEYLEDPAVRSAEVSLIGRGEAAWLFDRVDRLFEQAAARLGKAVRPVEEVLQLVRYDEGGHFQQWHSDAGVDAVERRLLSMSLELSEPEEYDGGELEIVPVRMGPCERPKGSACIFHSRLIHRVTPVTRGTRWALVGWTGGAGADPAPGQAIVREPGYS